MGDRNRYGPHGVGIVLKQDHITSIEVGGWRSGLCRQAYGAIDRNAGPTGKGGDDRHSDG